MQAKGLGRNRDSDLETLISMRRAAGDVLRAIIFALICLVWFGGRPAAAFTPEDVPNDFRGTFVSCMAKGESDPVAARDYAEQWLVSDTGGDDYAFYCLAIWTFHTGDPLRAAEIFERLSEQSGVRDSAYAGEFLRTAGDLYDAAKAPERAFRAYSKALERNRDLPDLWVDRALVRAELGDYEGTIADLDAALQLDSENVEALVFRGSSFLATDQLAAAADDALQALLLEPFNIPGLWLRAQIAMVEGDRALAIRDLERIIARDQGGFAERAREALEVIVRATAQKSTLE